MDQARDGQQARRLRAVGEEPVKDTGILGQAIAAVLDGAPGGLAPRALPAALAERLACALEQIGGRELDGARPARRERPRGRARRAPRAGQRGARRAV